MIDHVLDTGDNVLVADVERDGIIGGQAGTFTGKGADFTMLLTRADHRIP